MALETLVIGGDSALDWQGDGTAPLRRIEAVHRSPLDSDKLLVGNAPGLLIEFDSPEWPGGLLPLRFADGENIAPATLARGGTITAPNILDFGRSISVGSADVFDENDLALALEEILLDEPGGELKAFERKNFNAFGILVFIDLGGRFGVDRIRFYPRNTVQSSPATPFHNDFLRSFELFTNDGQALTDDGRRIWDPVALVTDSQEPVLDVSMSPSRLVQHIRLRSTTNVNYEIDEFEVFGRGFLSEARYISDIFDAGEPAVWGTLRWTEQAIGDSLFSRALIRTRTGSDDNPFVFTRTLQGKRDAEPIPFSLLDSQQEMGREEYEGLPSNDSSGRSWDPGPVENDLVDWSPYSTPYPVTAANGPGIPVSSPNPRRYLQFEVLFQTDNVEHARVLTSLTVDYQTPAFADEVVAEVFPREVEASTIGTFTYALRSTMRTGDNLGFDIVEVSTPSKVVSIDRIELADALGQPFAGRTFSGLDDTDLVEGFEILAVESEGFRLRLPHVTEDGTLVTIEFRTGVLTYSTNFQSSVQLSAEPGAQQLSASGNAAILDADDEDDFSGTTVLSPTLIGGRLLDRVTVAPNPFTPNGDGLNDETTVEYNLLSLSADRRVEIYIFDLSGRRVRTLHDGFEANGRYEDKRWNGRDDAGRLVPPGLYVARLAVEGDAIQDDKAVVIGVAY
jgi:hypothetical protein